MTGQQCMDYLNDNAGEVKYFRFCTRSGDPVKYALAEFTERSSVINALKLNGQVTKPSQLIFFECLNVLARFELCSRR